MDIKVSTKNDKGEKVETTLTYDMPETLAELVNKFGEAAVADGAKSSFVIGFQNTARRLLVPATDKSGKVIREALTGAALQAEVADWMPDTKSSGPRLSKLDRATQAVNAMTDDERRALLAKVQEALKASGAKKAA